MAAAPGLTPGRKKVLAMLRSTPSVQGEPSMNSRDPGTISTPIPTVASGPNFQPASPSGETPVLMPLFEVPKRAKE